MCHSDRGRANHSSRYRSGLNEGLQPELQRSAMRDEMPETLNEPQ